MSLLFPVAFLRFSFPHFPDIRSKIIDPMSKEDRDIEKSYSNKEFAAKLRRLADSVESGENFTIQVAGERIYVPDRAEFTIEHEREDGQEELEFQVKWSVEKDED